LFSFFNPLGIDVEAFTSISMSPASSGDIGQMQSQLIIVTGLWRKHVGLWRQKQLVKYKRNGGISAAAHVTKNTFQRLES